VTLENLAVTLGTLGDPALREVALLVRAEDRPVTADDVARALAVSRSVARWRLERLAAAGLVTVAFERRTGRSGPGAGRPAKIYSPVAETAAIEFPPRRYEQLAALLIAALPGRGRSEQLAQVGLGYGKQLAAASRLRPARSAAGAVKGLTRALGRLGFHVAIESVSEEEAVLVSATCPLRPLVAAEPTARAIDEGMWRGFVEAAAGNRAADVRCSTHHCLDRNAPCRIVLGFALGGT
jgi:predicted ArsR family transcriptional regulator